MREDRDGQVDGNDIPNVERERERDIFERQVDGEKTATSADGLGFDARSPSAAPQQNPCLIASALVAW